MSKTFIRPLLILLLVQLSKGRSYSGETYQHWNTLGASGHPFGRCYQNGKVVPCPYNPGPNNIHPTRQPTYKPWLPGGGTPDPESEETKLILERYRIARTLSAENLFALTEAEVLNFTNRIFDEIKVEIPGCNLTFPPFTDCKVQELAFIFRKNQCVLTNSTVATPAPPPPPATNNNAASGTARRRVRRMAQPLATIQNADGSVSRVMRCEGRRTVTKNGLLRLCRTCYVQTTLPEGRFPRFLNEVTCSYIPPNTRTMVVDSSTANSAPNLNQVDRFCLSGSGNCIEGTVTVEFLRDQNNAGLNNLERWVNYPQTIRSSCTCQLTQTSVLRLFV